jgi:hypothetical protein
VTDTINQGPHFSAGIVVPSNWSRDHAVRHARRTTFLARICGWRRVCVGGQASSSCNPTVVGIFDCNDHLTGPGSLLEAGEITIADTLPILSCSEHDAFSSRPEAEYAPSSDDEVPCPARRVNALLSKWQQVGLGRPASLVEAREAPRRLSLQSETGIRTTRYGGP